MQAAFISRLVAIIGAIVTIVPFLYGLSGPVFDQSRPFLLAFAGLCLIWYAVTEIRDWHHGRETKFRTDQQFYEFMKSWIEPEGDATVFVRDLSWTKDEEIRKMLLKKASEKCLTVIMESSIAFSRELARSGAEVYYYEDIGFVPRSRFTMMNRFGDQSRVAVGWELAGPHPLTPLRVVKVYRSGQDPFSSAAKDLIDLLMKSDRARRCDGLEGV